MILSNRSIRFNNSMFPVSVKIVDCRFMSQRRRLWTTEKYARSQQTFVIGKFGGVPSEYFVSRIDSMLSNGLDRHSYDVEWTFWNWYRWVYGCWTNYGGKQVSFGFKTLHTFRVRVCVTGLVWSPTPEQRVLYLNDPTCMISWKKWLIKI